MLLGGISTMTTRCGDTEEKAGGRCFEPRIYHINEGKPDELNTRFRDYHEVVSEAWHDECRLPGAIGKSPAAGSSYPD